MNIIGAEVVLIFPNGYEVVLNGDLIPPSIGESIEFAGGTFIISDINHRFVPIPDSENKSDRVQKTAIFLKIEDRKGVFYQNPDGTETKIQ